MKKATAKKTKEKDGGGGSELVVRMPDKTTVPVPAKETPELLVRVAAEKVILDAFNLRASQVDLLPTGKDQNYVVSFLVDSVRQNGDSIPVADAMKIIDFWKAAAKLDLADRRKRLVGDCKVERGADAKPVRVISSGSQQGVRISLLIDPEKAVRRSLEQTGLMDAQVTELKSIVSEGKGVVLLAAPPDQGRTTTLYTIVRMHDAYTSNVQTVEVDIQDSLEGVRQNRFDPGQADGPEYFSLVRSILRRDPNVIAVAELPDAATAKELAKADPERTRSYISIPADSAMTAISGYVQAVGDSDLAAKSLHGVVAQKLMRKLCGNCKQAYQPTPDVLKKLGLPADKVKQLFKKGGQVLIKNKPEVCPACKGSGYFGAEGIFEVYLLDDACRDRVRAKDMNGLRGELRKKQLPSIQQAALRRAIDGTTSVEEVVRVTSDAKEAKEGGAPAQPAAPAQPSQPKK
jgi:general secretion pathway protein E